MSELSDVRKQFKFRALCDFSVLLCIAVIIFVISIAYNISDKIIKLGQKYNDYLVGELIFALIITGLCSLVYLIRRSQDLNKQISLRDAADRNVAWIAQHDLLTKLPNRHFLHKFIDHIDDSMEQGLAQKKLAIYAIDLDGFKKVNDFIGHKGGDELLVNLAQRLDQVLFDELIFRLGSDEFVIIADWQSDRKMEEFAGELIDVISQPMKISNLNVEVGACIGITCYPEDGTNFSECLHNADIAMYAAKNNGRGTVKRFRKFMNDFLIKRAELEHALRDAIHNKELFPHYQPLVDLKTNRICGFEALARWINHEGEVIPPGVFIEIAEESGMIQSLTENLLRQACQDARQWPSDVKLSFNISPTQLTDETLGLRILKILSDTGFSPSRLELEITESTLINDTEIAIRILEDLHNFGVSIAIDDFGTGYSSLSHLSHFEFDKIKIDRSFVMELEKNEKNLKVVRAILSLGRGLGIQTLAEGIETEEQLAEFKKLGCDLGQGYHLGKPMAADDALQLFENDNKTLKKRQPDLAIINVH